MMHFQLSPPTSEAAIMIGQFPVKVTRANLEGLAADCEGSQLSPFCDGWVFKQVSKNDQRTS
jgi:hypothetical protein